MTHHITNPKIHEKKSFSPTKFQTSRFIAVTTEGTVGDQILAGSPTQIVPYHGTIQGRRPSIAACCSQPSHHFASSGAASPRMSAVATSDLFFRPHPGKILHEYHRLGRK